MFNRKIAKEKSKTLLRTRSFLDFLGFALVLVTVGAVSVVPIVSIVALLLYMAGMNRAALRMNRGEDNVRIIDIALAGDMLGKYIKIFLWQALLLILWTLPSLAAVGLGVLALLAGRVGRVISVLLFIIAAAWSIFIIVYKALQYSMSYYIAEDNRNITAHDCINESIAITKDHIWDLFVLDLSFLGWDILLSSLVLFPIPIMVFLVPYKSLTYASIYEQLRGSFKAINQHEWLSNGMNGIKRSAPASAPAQPENVVHAIEVLSGEYTGTRFDLKEGEIINIGRDPQKSNVVISAENNAVSGLHCSVRFNKGTNKFVITDYSINGTFINGQRIGKEIPVNVDRGANVKIANGAMLFRLI